MMSHCAGCPHYADEPPPKVDVVITSHNYGHFLQDALDSLADQFPLVVGSIVVVDDASDPGDQAKAICDKWGIEYIRIEARSVYQARKAGLLATKSPLVCFLDADDMLSPEYLKEGAALFSSDRVGIVTSDLQQFGDKTDIISHPERNIETRNWIHAGSIVRRSALESSAAFEQPDPSVNSHADWYVWRAVVRNGWEVKRNPAHYLYRQHPDSMMKQRRQKTYYQLASLANEPITLCLPISGRTEYWDRLRGWVERQTRITDLLIIDSSPAEFRQELRRWAMGLPVRSVKIVSLPESDGLADLNRTNQKVYRKVQQTMPRVYSHLRNSLATELALIVEDDVLPPNDAIERLLRGMEHDVAAVSGLVPSRWRPKFAVAWQESSGNSLRLADRKPGVVQVGGTGFGCLLLRRSAMLQAPPFHAGGETGNYDVEFAKSIAAADWRWLLDWSVWCEHGDWKPEESRRRKTCAHRGEAIRQEKCEICGTQNGPVGTVVTVYACEIHGECVKARHKAGKKVASCSVCEDYAEPLVQLSMGLLPTA
jgi:glycosyltransferase involved in cell wall biosynthesis